LGKYPWEVATWEKSFGKVHRLIRLCSFSFFHLKKVEQGQDLDKGRSGVGQDIVKDVHVKG